MFLFVGTAFAQSPTSIFDPAATPAHSAFGLSMLVLSVTLVIFLLVAGLLLYVLIRYRRRPTDSDEEPAQIYGSDQIELSWTVIPILIVVMLFLSTTRVILETEAAPKPVEMASSFEELTKIGDQWRESDNRFYGLRIDGHFNNIHTRATKATKVGLPLAEAAAIQPEFHFEDVNGTLVSILASQFSSVFNVAGYRAG